VRKGGFIAVNEGERRRGGRRSSRETKPGGFAQEFESQFPDEDNVSIEKQKQLALATIPSNASTRVEPESFGDRGHDDLRAPEEAEWWLRKGLAFRRGARYEEAFACYERAIQLQPDRSEIQFMLGVSFDSGEGVPRNDAMATAWYHKAANQGLKEAQYNLGLSYYCGCADGSGLGPDYEQAAHWFRGAAEQGFEPAQDKLGSLYGLGLVVPQDAADAFRWYEKAARQGYKEAQRIVGDLRRDGQRIFQDYAAAAWWYHKAALQGDLPAQISLAQMYLQELVPRSLSLGFTSGANSEDAPGNWGRDGVIYWRYSCKVGAAYWFGKAAQQGSAVAISALAEMQPFLALEHAKEILKDSRSAHYNFGSNVEARKRHTAKIRDAVTVLKNAGYELNKWDYELGIQ